jgi:hypothetical protein
MTKDQWLQALVDLGITNEIDACKMMRIIEKESAERSIRMFNHALATQ